MDQKQDYKEKYEKIRLHIIYLIIIAVILAVIGISIALGGKSEALGQISMASTVSSIILSSIAIFMSISGENKLNYTHDKLVETSDRMSEITGHIEKANSMLDGTINQKLTKIDDIFDKLESIGQSVDIVQKEVINRTTLRVEDNNIVNISSDILWQIYNSITGKYTIYDIAAKAVMEYVIVCFDEGSRLLVDNMDMYVKSVIGSSDRYHIGYTFGVIMMFLNMGIIRKENIIYFKERMMLSEEKWNEIKKLL